MSDNFIIMKLSTKTARRSYQAPSQRIIASDLESDFLASSNDELQDLETHWIYEEDF